MNHATSFPSPLHRLLRPATIAVIGGKLAAEVIRQCERIGFAGEIWPINPKQTAVEGRRTFATVDALPAAPDVTFIAVHKHLTIEAVSQLARRGAGGVVCYASGFAEESGEGVALQQQLIEAAGAMPLVGPNCYGLLNYLDGVALWPDQHGGERVTKGAAIVLQSGNIGLNLTMQRRGLELAYLITVGNKAGVKLHQYIEGLLADQRVTAIGLHIEGLDDLAAFSQAAIHALAKRVPIVVLKTGASEQAQQITKSHTSALAASDRLCDALFDRLGVMRVYSLPQMLEALKLLSFIGTLPGDSIASISCSGGEAALMADTAARLGLPLAPMVPEQRDALYAVLGDKVALSNPLDYHTYIWGNEAAQTACFAAMMLGPQQITLKILDYPRPDRCQDAAWRVTARAFAQAAKQRGVPAALLATLPENLPDVHQKWLLAEGIAPMQGVEECLLAIQGAARMYAKQERWQEILPVRSQETSASSVEPSEVRSQKSGVNSQRLMVNGQWSMVNEGWSHDEQIQNPKLVLRATNVSKIQNHVRTLNEAESKELLREYGLPTPKSGVANGENAGEVAEQIGFPVVVKILSETILHKSDVGGVALNLCDQEAVRQAVASMRGLGDQFLIEAMAAKPVAELIVGLTRDPHFGVVMVVGSGGVWVELFKDSVPLLLPVTRQEVEQALDRLKIAPILKGFRGGEAADRSALVAALLQVARLAEDHADRLLEVDLNPVFALPQGQGVMVVDAVVRMRS